MYDQNQESQAPKYIYIYICMYVWIHLWEREKGEGEDKTQNLRGVMTERKLSNQNQIVRIPTNVQKLTHSLFGTEAAHVKDDG